MSLSPVRVMSVCALVVAVFASVLAWGVSSARAATPFFLVGGFAEVGPFGGTGDGYLHHGHRIAVDSSGQVLRADPIGKRVVVYSPSESGASESTSFGSGELVAPFGVAVDQSSGSVYVSDAGSEDVGGRVVRYLTDGGGSYWLDGDYTSPVAGSGAGEVGDFRAAIALDPTSGKLLVADPADDLVQRYATDGSYDGFSFDGPGSAGGVFTGLQDLAIDSTGDVVVVDSDGGDPADGAAGRVERFDSDGVWEESIGPVENAANVAVRPVTGEVLVSGNQDAVNDGQPPYPALFVFD
ncbi:MAG TPA: NHL repeat-containing protein, partial [Solirubrobacterales bacterium]|nr:NHL repeat-containing protein [Solirubrobacterales bacterium]